jgi:ubiquitin-conjugating enzyme E2 J2
MITPSGRFKTNTRLCLSISDYHPKTWNPAWSVSTILTGLLSFMVSDESTAGSIISTDDQKREFAKLSYEYNLRSNPRFLEHFPDLVKENSEMIEKKNLERQKEKALKQLAKINVRNQISTLEIPPTSATTVPAQPSVGLTARQKLLCIGIVVVSSMIAYRALI